MTTQFPTDIPIKSCSVKYYNQNVENITQNNRLFATRFDKAVRLGFEVVTQPLTETQFGKVLGFIANKVGPKDSFTFIHPTISDPRGTITEPSPGVVTMFAHSEPPGGSDFFNPAVTEWPAGSTTIFATRSGSGDLRQGDLIKFVNHNKVYIVTGGFNPVFPDTQELSFFPGLRITLDTLATFDGTSGVYPADSGIIHHNVPIRVYCENIEINYNIGVENLTEIVLQFVEDTFDA